MARRKPGANKRGETVVTSVTTAQIQEYQALKTAHNKAVDMANRPVIFVLSAVIAPLLIEALFIRSWSLFRAYTDAVVENIKHSVSKDVDEFNQEYFNVYIEQNNLSRILDIINRYSSTRERNIHDPGSMAVIFNQQKTYPVLSSYLQVLEFQIRFFQSGNAAKHYYPPGRVSTRSSFFKADKGAAFIVDESSYTGLTGVEFLEKIEARFFELRDTINNTMYAALKDPVISDDFLRNHHYRNIEIFLVFLLQWFVIVYVARSVFKSGFLLSAPASPKKHIEDMSSREFELYLKEFRQGLVPIQRIAGRRNIYAVLSTMAYALFAVAKYWYEGDEPEPVSEAMMVTVVAYMLNALKSNLYQRYQAWSYDRKMQQRRNIIARLVENCWVESVDDVLGTKSIESAGLLLTISKQRGVSLTQWIRFFEHALKHVGFLTQDEQHIRHIFLPANQYFSEEAMDKLVALLENGLARFDAISNLRKKLEALTTPYVPSESFSIEDNGLPVVRWVLFLPILMSDEDNFKTLCSDAFEAPADINISFINEGVYIEFTGFELNEAAFDALKSLALENAIKHKDAAGPHHIKPYDVAGSYDEARSARKNDKVKTRGQADDRQQETAAPVEDKLIRWAPNFVFNQAANDSHIQPIRRMPVGPGKTAYAVMTVPPEDFSGGENGGVHTSFVNIFKSPVVVPAEKATGLKWQGGRLKAKTAFGGNGHLRIFADPPVKDATGNNLLYVFNRLGRD